MRGRFGIFIATNKKGKEGNVGYNSSQHPHFTSVTHYPWTFLVHIWPWRFSVEKKHCACRKHCAKRDLTSLRINCGLECSDPSDLVDASQMEATQPLKRSQSHSEEPGHCIFHVLIHEVFAKKQHKTSLRHQFLQYKKNNWKNMICLNLRTNRRCTCFLPRRKHSIIVGDRKKCGSQRTRSSNVVSKLKNTYFTNSRKWTFPWTNRNDLNLTANRGWPSIKMLLLVQDSSEPITVGNYIFSLCYSGFLTSQLDWFAGFLVT